MCSSGNTSESVRLSWSAIANLGLPFLAPEICVRVTFAPPHSPHPQMGKATYPRIRTQQELALMPMMSLLREDRHLQIESGAGESGTRLHVIGFDNPQIVLRLATHRQVTTPAAVGLWVGLHVLSLRGKLRRFRCHTAPPRW